MTWLAENPRTGLIGSNLGQILGRAGHRDLTVMRLGSRERQVANLYCDGKSRAQISRKLGIAPSTVKAILQRLRKKVDAPTMHAARPAFFRICGRRP